MAGGAAWLQFGSDGVACLFVRRVVVEFEKVGALAVDAFVVVGFVHHALLACGGMASAIRGIDWLTFHVVH